VKSLLNGIAASGGIAIGRAFVMKESELSITKKKIENRKAENERFQDAVNTAKQQLGQILQANESLWGPDKTEIFEAHLIILEDPEFVGDIELQIETEGINAEYAVKVTMDKIASKLGSLDNEYMRERASDVKDIGKRIQTILLGESLFSVSEINKDSILVAVDLAPSDTAQMNNGNILGFVTDIGGRTSHSAIMARSYEIPAIVGTGRATAVVKNGDVLVVDGEAGIVIINPTEEVLEKYKRKQSEMIESNKKLFELKEAESITIDGRKVELAANIGTSDEVEGVLSNGAEGIGLFRTEFLYMGKSSLPTEDEQFIAYKEIVERMEDKSVVIRTLDIGGDKKLSYLPIPDEMNPFLGYRAIRLCLDRKDIFKPQLRALLRASVYGNLKIMFPMISNLQELREVKNVLKEVQLELKENLIAYNESIEIGMMIEIPSAALISDQFAKEVDFFSIGTNDLIQYTVAVDRMNERISHLFDPFHPAVLRLIKMVIDNGHKAGKWVGMCGEMAGDPAIIPLLIGMGLDEFSMSVSSILKARKLIRSMEFNEVKKMTESVLQLATSDDIKRYLEEHLG
jgi:phosphotransferase system enzyme I (PtsI)